MDSAALLDYLKGKGLMPLSCRSLNIKQFSHGESNPTYLLTCEEEEHIPKLVLRKQPSGKLLKGAHNVLREAAIMQLLPHLAPRILLVEEELLAAVGTPFFIMEFKQGQIYRDPALPDCSPTQRHCIYNGLAKALAAIHSSPVPFSSPSSSSSSSSSYCTRQVQIWSEQYRKSREMVAADEPEMKQLQAWLTLNIPSTSTTLIESSRAPCISHGDYRLDNLIFSSDPSLAPGTLIAVLDFELASLDGDPVADLAFCLLGHYLPAKGFLSSLALVGRKDAVDPHALPQGVPAVDEFCAIYRSHLRRDDLFIPSSCSKEFKFYLSLGFFRIAAICAGVHARAVLGNASRGAKSLAFAQAVPLLAKTALELIKSSSSPTSLTSPPPPHPEMPLPSFHTTPSPKCQELLLKLRQFIDEDVIPAERQLTTHAAQAHGVWPTRGDKWTLHPLILSLTEQAKARGLWNLWLTKGILDTLQKMHPQWPWSELVPHERGLSHTDYAHIAIESGRSLFCPHAINCSAPDTGNMEILAKFGTGEQQQRYLLPILNGSMKSCFAMTEPAVGSSDPTQLQATARLVKNERGEETWIINGRKWWTTNANDPRCKCCIFVALTATEEDKKGSVKTPSHARHTFFLLPMDKEGVSVVRPLTVFGYDDAPFGHAETLFENVQVGAKEAIIGKIGGGFELAQSRLGPGRLHHCARLVGHGERGVSEIVKRGTKRQAFGKSLLELGGNAEKLAMARVLLHQAKLSVLDAAKELDQHEAQGHRKLSSNAMRSLAVCKICVPRALQETMDFAIQIHGGGGLSDDHPLAAMWAAARTLRLVDGPDEVHLRTLYKLEMQSQSSLHPGVGKARL